MRAPQAAALSLAAASRPSADSPITRAIRALDGPLARIPIVGLTANAMSHQQRSYVDAGMSGVVAKPISPAALLSEIARVMGESADGRLAAAKDNAAA